MPILIERAKYVGVLDRVKCNDYSKMYASILSEIEESNFVLGFLAF